MANAITSKTWQLQAAKNKFSEVVSAAQKRPQVITKHGRNTAVLLSYDQYRRIVQPKRDLKEVLMSVDLSELSLSRDRSPSGRATPFALG